MELTRIKKIIAEQFNIDEETVTENTTFKEDLKADSLDVFQLITALEEEFNLEFSNDAANNIKTVGDVAKAIQSML